MVINEWNKDNYKDFIDYLYSLEDKDYKEFNSKIMGNTKYKVIGIRCPLLDGIAKSISKGDYKGFIEFNKNCDIYESIMIEAYLFKYIKNDFDLYFDDFIKKIDNWSVCDTLCTSIKYVKGNKKIFNKFIKLMKNRKEFISRVGIVGILVNFIDSDYLNDIIDGINGVKCNKYYTSMAVAWLVSMLYVKYPDFTYNFLSNCKLNDFIVNKSIDKIRDSFRVSDIDKKRANLLKRKVSYE